LKDSGSFSALTYLSLFGLAITVPLLLLLGALLLQSASVQRTQLQDRVLQVLDALVNDIDRDLDRDITILHTLATSQALASADWPTFYDQAKAGLQGRAYLVLIDSNGRQLVNTYVPYGQQPAMTGDPETLRRIAQTKEPVVSNLFVSLAVKKPVFNVSIPILQDGQVRYVMSLGLLLDDLVALLTSQKLEPQWVTLILDAKGMILARSQNNARYTGTPLPENMREHNQRDVVRTRNLDGTDVLHATVRSRVSGWGIGVNVPYSLITVQMRNSLLLWSAAAVLAITIALALGLFFARQITTSLAVAAKAAAAFGHGEPFPLTGSRLKEADTFLATLNNAQQAREKLTEEVKQSRDWLQTTLASIGDAVIATDTNGAVTFLNPVAETLTGWKQEEAFGQPLETIFQIVNERTRRKVENPALHAIQDGLIVGLANHTLLIARNGKEVPIDDAGSPIRDADGKTLGAVLIFRDVTARRQAEHLQAELFERERLARQSAQAAREAAEEAEQREQLLRKAAENANRAKDEFLAMVSHELRNPLNAILGWAHILRTGQMPLASGGHAIEVIERNARAEAQLVESLLDLSRIVAGKLHLDSERVDLAAVLQTVVDSLRPSADAKGVSMEIATTDTVVVVGDSGRLQQVFSNLVTNAIKFTPRGGHIHVRLSRVASNARIQVIDDGEGINANLLPHIFDRFRQGESTKARSHGGLGLGLAIVRELVNAHAGTVVAESPGKGRGSSFTVTIPIPALIPAHFETANPRLVHAEEASISGLRILVVDDDGDARELVGLTLQSHGALVKMASSSREALRLISREKPDVMVADIGMPQEDGYVLIQALRALEREHSDTRLPVIALTAYASEADRDQALAAGYDLHLAKPVSPADLTQALSKFRRTKGSQA
jgi:PAS domain S-box-containing protein